MVIVIGNISSLVSGVGAVKLGGVTAAGSGGVALLGSESKESRIGEEEGIIGGRGGVDTTTWLLLPLVWALYGE